MSTNKKKVVLIQGGLGAERKVSLSTGAGFKQALIELGYPFEVIDAQEDLMVQLSKIQADVALLALHGKYAEDGIVQSICEYLKLPYTGSGVLASALCMDKLMSKQILEQAGIQTAPYQVLDVKLKDIADFQCEIPLPLVVKPTREGSSVGVSIVKNNSELPKALKEAAKYDHLILIEKYIPGKEITVPILEDKALCPIEIQPKVDFYNYENKYTAGNTEYHLPARITDEQLAQVKKLSLEACHHLRVRTYGRVDFRMTDEGEFYLIEVNTLPGATPTSLLPQSAKYEGIHFNEVVRILVEEASLDYAGLS